MFGYVCGGSRLASGVPGANGWNGGWIVLTDQSPHTVPAGGVGWPGRTRQLPSGLAAWVSAASLSPVVGCSGVLAGKPSAPTTECRSALLPSATAFG